MPPSHKNNSNIHQTLDFPKNKKHSKRPTILKADCDQHDSNNDMHSSDSKYNC